MYFVPKLFMVFVTTIVVVIRCYLIHFTYYSSSTLHLSYFFYVVQNPICSSVEFFSLLMLSEDFHFFSIVNLSEEFPHMISLMNLMSAYRIYVLLFLSVGQSYSLMRYVKEFRPLGNF